MDAGGLSQSGLSLDNMCRDVSTSLVRAFGAGTSCNAQFNNIGRDRYRRQVEAHTPPINRRQVHFPDNRYLPNPWASICGTAEGDNLPVDPESNR